jgi:ABC-type Fe2+-enterobactin transport system substrate-binding protein
LRIFSGSIPANCAAADAGTLLATITLPSDWLAAASGTTKVNTGIAYSLPFMEQWRYEVHDSRYLRHRLG